MLCRARKQVQGRELDRDALHRRLWGDAQSNRMHVVEIHQSTLAHLLRVNNSTLSAAMRDLKAAGKIRKVSAKQGNIGVYAVKAPA